MADSGRPSLSGSVPLGGDQPPQPVPPPGAAMDSHRTLPHALPRPESPGLTIPGQLSGVAQDPMAKLIDLPSGGLFYPNRLMQVRIRPTRGEQEEMLAGTPEESPDRVRAIREVVAQCVDLQGLPFDDLLILDFGAITMHLFALSAGTDEVTIRAGCDKQDCPLGEKRLSLTTLPCVYLREAGPGEVPSSEVPEDDPDIVAAKLALEAMGEKEEDPGPEFRKVGAGDVREPFKAVLAGGRLTIEWRHHRIRDLVAAEEYARATGDTSVAIGAKLGSFLSARQIVSINGEPQGTISALQWWKRAPSPVLREFREKIGARTFGFNMRPEFRCPRTDCRKKVRVKLPNDGSLFRSGA